MIDQELIRLALLEASNEILSVDKLMEYQVLCLPENFGKNGELLDADDSIVLSKLLKSANLKCANSYDLNLNSSTIERRSYDIWLGQLYVVDHFILPVVINIISNYLISKFSKKQKTEPSLPQPQVNIEFKFFQNGRLDSITYQGSPDSLINILNSLKSKNDEVEPR